MVNRRTPRQDQSSNVLAGKTSKQADHEVRLLSFSLV